MTEARSRSLRGMLRPWFFCVYECGSNALQRKLAKEVLQAHFPH